MQYETIVLELLSRIQVLEQDMATLKEAVARLGEKQAREPAEASDGRRAGREEEPEEAQPSVSYGKVTEEMIDCCYVYGKKSVEHPDANFWDYADEIVKETGMNRNSAFMYMYVVRCLLEGSVFKRSISTKAMNRYLTRIEEEYGKVGLARAIQAVEAFMEYRRATDQPVGAVEKICQVYQQRL